MMMLREARQFLDLDMVVQTILDEGDRSLLLEAIQCYQIGSHRAAVILAWCATADCLKRHIQELAGEGDAQAQQAQTELKAVEGLSSYEENLIGCARKCELIDDFDEKSLRFARDTRSQCAHPTGVIPSAEAVRHIIYICTQAVLSRRGYRGISFVTDVVTTQFDDRHFLPEEKKVDGHCRRIIEKVPLRLYPQFARVAAQKRPGPNSDVWQKNALVFFRTLLLDADNHTAKQVAAALQGFEARSPDFFAALVGIDDRVTKFWDEQKRAQARARLISASAVRVSAENVHSWAVICAADGIDKADEDLLRQRIGGMARYVASEKLLLIEQRDRVLEILQSMLLEDSTADQAVIGLSHLLPTELFDVKSDPMQVIIETIIERFSRDTRYRRLLDAASEWTTSLLAGFLEQTELFLNECSEDNADDILILFEVAGELIQRSPLNIPAAFPGVINRVLKRELFPDWSHDTSSVGRVFHGQLSLLLQQQKPALPSIEDALIIRFDAEDDDETTSVQGDLQ